MSLCETEKIFIIHGAADDFRVDGRRRMDYRSMELETDIISHAFGSARLRLTNTDIIAAVKLEVDVPFPETPHLGKIEFFVDCSANATPEFEGRGGEELATMLSTTLNSAYSSPSAFDLKKLCILQGRKCWKLYVDILILECCGGNLFDTASIATKAALWQAQVPLIKNIIIDGSNVELNVSDLLVDCTKLDVKNAPIMVTICKVGENIIIDPNMEEQKCSMGSVIVAVSGNKFTTIYQTGAGSLHPTTLLESIKLGFEVAQAVDKTLIDILKQNNQDQDVGFLK